MKQPGHCTLCEQAIFEIAERSGDESLCRLGAPLDHARRATLLLMNGTLMDLSFCQGCLASIDRKLPAIWAKVIEAFQYEREVLWPELIRLGRRTPLTEEQARQDEFNLLALMESPPLGVIATQRFEHANP